MFAKNILVNMKFLNKNFIYLLIFNLQLINCAVTTLRPDFGSVNSSISASIILPSSKQISCSAAFQATRNGFNLTDVTHEPIKVNKLRYCEIPLSGTCCTPAIENKLAVNSRLQLEKNTKDAIGKLSSVLGTRAQKFNQFFKKLLAFSKEEFHSMFKRTYGTIYEENSYVFASLFSELEGYYSHGKVDLTETMESFFNILYQKMFTVLNQQYAFDDKYLGCVSEHMKDLKPFGDVPDKLSVQIKRSFVATRTYAQALNSIAEVAKNMMNVRPTAECTAALTKMGTCNTCNGFTEKPCASYCSNVMKGCLQHYIELDAEWDNFVVSMDRLSERLLGPFNIVMVVEPINIKISEAIMNFQDLGQDISNQVFHGCGKPVLKGIRRKRSSKTPSTDQSNRELKYEPMQFSSGDVQFTNSNQNHHHHQTNAAGSANTGRRKNQNQNRKKQNNNDEDEEVSSSREREREPGLDRLVKDIKQKVKDSKKFWSNLPYQLCNSEDVAAPSSDGNCWNGHTVDRYDHPDRNSEAMSTSSNSRQNSIVASQLYALRTAVNHLRSAYQGNDVEWSDQEDSVYGSGSGDGSGIDDDTGSGLGTWDDPTSIHPIDEEHDPKVNIISRTDAEDDTGHPSLNNKGIDILRSDFTIPSSSGGTYQTSKMSITRALATIFIPIFMAWFGGIFSDLL